MAAAAGAQAALRRRHRRRRLARPRDRVLPREAPWDPQRLHPREVVHRLRCVGPEHDDHPRQLPDARGRRVLPREREALPATLGRARLQPHVLAARAPHARALRPRDDDDAGAGRGEPDPRDRLEGRRAGRDPRAVSADRPLRPPRVPDPGRALPPAGRDHSPRRRRVGVRPRRRPPRGRDPPVHRGHGVRARGRPRHRRSRRRAAASSADRS